MDGMSLLGSERHGEKIKKKIKKFRNSNFLTDMQIVCQDGTVSAHKIIFLQKLQNFSHYLCSSCDHHSDTTIILPDIEKSEIQTEVKNLYSDGSVAGLEEILGFEKKDKPLEEESEIETGNPQLELRNEVDGSITLVSEAFEEVSHFGESTVSTKAENVAMSSNHDTTEEILDDIVEDIDQVSVSDIDNIENNEDPVEMFDGLEADSGDDVTPHNFEILAGRTKGIRTPGVLFVNNRFKFWCKSVRDNGKFFYVCVEGKRKRCPAKALVKSDDDTSQLVVIRCAMDTAHNHEPSKDETNKIVNKMTKEMIEMVMVF